MSVSTPDQIQQIWTKINRPTHTDVIALVEKHAVSLLTWKIEAFSADYSKLEQHLLKTIVLPDDVPTREELRTCGGTMSLYDAYRIHNKASSLGGRRLEDFVNKSQCYFYSEHTPFARIGSWLNLLNDALRNMEQHVSKMRLDRGAQRIEADRVRENAIQLRKAKQLAEEESEARRRLAAIEWEEGRVAREEAKRLEEEARESRILAKMEELRATKR